MTHQPHRLRGTVPFATGRTWFIVNCVNHRCNDLILIGPSRYEAWKSTAYAGDALCDDCIWFESAMNAKTDWPSA